jgi:hypothetical protein
MLTGEPRHTDHDDGQLLQRAVDDAFRRNDVEIIRLAQRAASPIVPRIGLLISTVDDLPRLDIGTPDVLKLTRPVSSNVDIFASVNGGDSVRIAGLFRAPIDRVLPPAATKPGLHIRLRAHITYIAEDTVPPQETRDLPDVVYAIYDPAESHDDSRTFVVSVRP